MTCEHHLSQYVLLSNWPAALACARPVSVSAASVQPVKVFLHICRTLTMTHQY